ncbi:MAG: hypothetical protein H6591_05100 [Flavobacteriales bacterium]|nr:hypothetical protein [Flavobacteriales bacterium]
MRVLTGCFLAARLTATAYAQPQFENASFEAWNNVGQATEEPVDWSSLKTSDGGIIINSLVPQLCWRSTDAHSGSYSVNLRTVNSAAGTANGLLTNGRVHAELNISNSYMFTDQGDGQWNTPMGSRPDSLVGWYKSSPTGTDRANIGGLLHVDEGRLPAFGTEANWVAGVSWKGPFAQVGTWTRFSKEFTYINGNAPEWILMILTAGDSAGSQVGTQVWYDDLALIYNVHCMPAAQSVSPGGSFFVDYSTGGTPVNAVNFSVELSDANGDFSAPAVIGEITSTTATGSIACAIPAQTVAGNGYQVRVVGGSPYYAPVGCDLVVELGTGVDELSRTGVSMHMVGGMVLVQASWPSAFEVLTSDGRLVRTGSLRPGANQIGIDASCGMVLLRIWNDRGVECRRFISN